MATWEHCSHYFAADGALRDIYAVGGPAGWRALLQVLATAAPTFEIDGEDRPLPRTVDEAFTAASKASVVLRATWGGILLCCHFFDPGQVELDIDPRDVDSPARFEALLEFMRALAKQSGGAVRLTQENSPECPMLQVTPEGLVTDLGAQIALSAPGSSPGPRSRA